MYKAGEKIMNVNNWDNESATANVSRTNQFGSGIGNESVVDRAKKAVVDKLYTVSEKLQQQTNREGLNGDLKHYGQQAANWLDKSAGYVSDMNPQQLKDDVKNQVQSNPGRSLLIAGGIGLLVGAVLRRR